MVALRSRIQALSALALLLVAALAVILWLGYAGNAEQPQPSTKTLRFSFELKNESGDFIERSELISLAPIDLDGYQKRLSVSPDGLADSDDSIPADEIVLPVLNLPPYGSRMLTTTMAVQVYDGPSRENIDPSLFLQSKKYIETEDPVVRAKAETLANRGMDDPQSLFRWVRENMSDSGYVAANLGASHAIDKLEGDCTEYMYAFIALARANGIPARGVAGFVVEGKTALVDSSDYHNWAEYHDGEKWVLVDPYYGRFDEDYQNYVAFRFIGSQSGPQEFASRFMAVDKRISVRL